MKKYLYIALTLFVSLLTSCSETNNESTEFDNWQQRNETFFTSIYEQAKEAIAKNDSSWKIIRAYTKNPLTTDTKNFIVVKVLKNSELPADAETPLVTDSVKLHYRGYLMQSDSYNTAVEGYPVNVGYSFDSSWTGDYNLPTMLPTKMVPGQMVIGFGTAMQCMRRGDRWLVFMPSSLAYGAKAQDNVPAYSTLMFDMTVEDFWKVRKEL